MASKRFRDAVGIDPERVVAAAVEAAMGDTRPRAKRHHPGRVLAAGAAVAAAAAVGQQRMPRLAKLPLRMGLRKLGDVTHVDELADALRDRLTGHEQEPDGDYEEDFDGEGYDDEDFDEEFDDEPRDEADDDEDDDDGFDDEDDEGFDDEPEDDEGPHGGGDEDEPDDDEPEADADEAGPEGEEAEDAEEDLEPEEDDEDREPDEDDGQIAARSLELGVSSGANGRRARDRVPDLFTALRTPHRRPPAMRRGSLRVDPVTRPPEPGESHARDERRNRSRKSKSTAARA